MKAGLAAAVYGAALLASRRDTLSGSVLGRLRRSGGTVRGDVYAGAPRRAGVSAGLGRGPRALEPAGRARPAGASGDAAHVKGRSAHSSTPELGVNAIYAAARVVFGLEILAGQLVDDPVYGAGRLAVTEVTSRGASRNAVPDRCELFLDRRLTVGETEAMSLLEVQRVIAREGVDADVRVIEHDIARHTRAEYCAHAAPRSVGRSRAASTDPGRAAGSA